jgi:hypothetical protein
MIKKKTSKKQPKGWKRYRHSERNEPEGKLLVKLEDDSVRFGEFYCGAFVMDGYCYNETPTIARRIRFIKKAT